MCKNNLLPDRFSRIDETNRSQHYYLSDEHSCLYLGEYFSRESYSASPTNQLVLNFKISPEKLCDTPGRIVHKGRAIAEVARALSCATRSSALERYTWIPLPPSKIVGHAGYDDRGTRVLAAAFNGRGADIRSILKQTESTEGDHARANRLSYEELCAITTIDSTQLALGPVRERIVLFDDVLTSGKHFKCGVETLRAAGLTQPIVGVFIARSVRRDAAVEFDNLDT